MSSRRRITLTLVGLIALVLVGGAVKGAMGDGGSAHTASRPAITSSSGVPGSDSGLPLTRLSALPAQAGRTWLLIERGGPFPYPRHDGVVFGNREKLLPRERSGYYHEYTVPTPGTRTRGARRLITGAGHELYYTGDHYRHFEVVDTSGYSAPSHQSGRN